MRNTFPYIFSIQPVTQNDLFSPKAESDEGQESSVNDCKGGCACGLVRYESRGEPTFSYLCQCRDCQMASGTGHAAIFMIDEEGLSVSGELRYFERRDQSGNLITRGFCPACGSPVIAPQELFTRFLCPCRLCLTRYIDGGPQRGNHASVAATNNLREPLAGSVPPSDGVIDGCCRRGGTT